LAARFEKVDLKDREGIETLGRTLMEQGGLGGIMTAGTDFSATVAWAAEKLGLPGIPFETALDASDKERMRRRFKAAGVPSPEFVILKSPPEEKPPFPWPVVVKPVDNMGSRGCRKVETLAYLKIAVADALGFSRSGRAIVEEYMEGPEFSVDALVYRGELTVCGFADRHIFFPPYFIEMGHTMPSGQDPALIQKLLETFSQGVKALGIDNGAAKGDIKLTPKGPMIGEIAARLSGGYMSGWTYPYSSGVLPTRGAIEIALGKKPGRLTPSWNWTCAERAFISIPGKVKSIEGGETAKVMPLVKDVFLRARPGVSVIFPENNVTKCGNIISAAASREDAVASAENAARSILIRLEAPNETTEAFLAVPPGSSSFPPDAFAVGKKILSLQSILPEADIKTGKNYHGVSWHIFPFTEFTESGLRDYMGRNIEESLEAVRTLTGMKLPVVADSTPKTVFLGRSFWRALIRGGYQGAAYYIDSLGKK
jgi:biotin carboxylase